MNDVKAILRFVQDQRDAVALEHSARKAFSSWTECDHPLIGLDAGTAAVTSVHLPRGIPSYRLQRRHKDACFLGLPDE